MFVVFLFVVRMFVVFLFVVRMFVVFLFIVRMFVVFLFIVRMFVARERFQVPERQLCKFGGLQDLNYLCLASNRLNWLFHESLKISTKPKDQVCAAQVCGLRRF